MTTYKEIRGTNIEAVASDPSNPVEGQVWYNTTTNVVKGLTINPGAWATGNNLNTTRNNGGLAGAGTQTSALAFGGYDPVPANTETYNGTSWTEVNDLNTARGYLAGSGASNTSALAFGGESPAVAVTESWNGTNWTEVNDLNVANGKMAGCGTNTAALSFGGNGSTTKTELWNGTNWTEVNSLNTGRRFLAGAGITTSALAFGGDTTPEAQTELYNGTNWTEVNDLNTGRDTLAGCGANNTSALAFAGAPSPAGPTAKNSTETWNGTNWTTVANTSVEAVKLAGAGTKALGLKIGGKNVNSTEEFTSGPSTVTFDVS